MQFSEKQERRLWMMRILWIMILITMIFSWILRIWRSCPSRWPSVYFRMGGDEDCIWQRKAFSSCHARDQAGNFQHTPTLALSIQRKRVDPYLFQAQKRLLKKRWKLKIGYELDVWYADRQQALNHNLKHHSEVLHLTSAINKTWWFCCPHRA